MARAERGRAGTRTRARIAMSGVVLRVDKPVPTHILGPVDLQVAAGERVAIVGPSGAGKTSLISIIGGMVSPTSGSYRFGDIDVAACSRRALCAFRSANVGFVFQAAHMVEDRTALENVELGLSVCRLGTREARDAARARLAAVGLDDVAARPAKLLSGGERQRVALARALAKRPRLLIADEPTGNLDRRTGERVLDLLLAVPEQDVTLLMVTHDPTAAARCDRVLAIADGRIEH